MAICYDPDAAPYDSADSHGDDLSGMGRKLLRQNPGMMYSPMDLERAYESIKGTKISNKSWTERRDVWKLCLYVHEFRQV